MPVGSIRNTHLDGTEDDAKEKKSHFKNMRKLYSILWSDKLLSQESFPAFHPFIMRCLDQDRRHGSRLLERIFLRRAISAVMRRESRDAVHIRNLLVLGRILMDNGCNLADISGFDVKDYAKKIDNTPVLESISRIFSEKGPTRFSREFVRLARGLRKSAQYSEPYALLWDTIIEPELQRPFELSATRLFLDPDYITFSDWRSEPRQALRVLRSDLRHLIKQRYMGTNNAKSPRDVLTKARAKPFHLVLDPGDSAGNCLHWLHGPEVIFKFQSGELLLYFMDNEYKENADNLFLLDYTLFFGSWSGSWGYQGPILRFLRILEMGPSITNTEFDVEQQEETTRLQSWIATSGIPPMTVLSIDNRMKFRPYLEVRGTAIPIYSPLTFLKKLFYRAHGKSEPFPTNMIDHALDLMTANGWSEHIDGRKHTSSKREENMLDASQHEPIAEYADEGKPSSSAQANNGDGGRVGRFFSLFRRSDTSKEQDGAADGCHENAAPDLNNVE